MEELIELDKDELFLGTTYIYEQFANDEVLFQKIFEKRGEELRRKEKGFSFKFLIFIVTFVLTSWPLVPAIIYDIVHVIKSSFNETNLLQMFLDSQLKLFFYFCFQIGLIVYLIFSIYQNLISESFGSSKGNSKYYNFDLEKENIVDLLFLERTNYNRLIRKKWIREEDREKIDETDVELSIAEGKSVLCQIYLVRIPFYWDYKIFLTTNRLEQILISSTPFFILSAISVGFLLISNFRIDNYIWAPVLFVLLAIATIYISTKTKNKSILAKIISILIVIIVIIYVGSLIAFIVFVNINAFSSRTLSYAHTISSYNIFFLVFIVFAVSSIVYTIFTFQERRKKIKEIRKKYENKIAEVEAGIYKKESSECTTELVVLYEKIRHLNRVSYFPVDLTKYITRFSTYYGVVTIIATIFVNVFTLL